MASQTLTVRLTGDGAWGFRLQGGTAPGVPLTVAKVRTKSKSYGVLEEGDVLISINGCKVKDMSYDDVVDVLDSVGQELVLEVVRSENKENVAPSYDQQRDDVSMDMHLKQRDEKINSETKFERSPVPPSSLPKLEKVQDDEEEDEEEEDEDEEEDEEEEESEEDVEKQPIVTLPKTPSPNLMGDVTTEHESKVTPEGTLLRSMRRELTASPFKEQETITEVRDEKTGSLQSHITKREEYTREIGGDTTGFKTPSPVPPVERKSASPMFKVNKFVPGGSSVYGVTEKLSKATTTTTSLSSNLSNFNEDLLNLTKKLDAGLNARTPTPTKTPTSTTPVPQQIPSTPTPNIIQPSTYTPEPNIPPPPPPPSNNKQRPISMPSLDFNILDAIENKKIVMEDTKTTMTKFSKTTKTTTKDGHTTSVSDEESERFQKLMKAFKPPPEDEGDLTPTRKKKMFSSSSFYEEPRHIYPTMEEQVKLCKSIADSLSSDTNKTSRGASMYIKRMKRAHKWVTEGPDPVSSDGESPQIQDPQQRPLFYDDGRPRLKLVLDPRGIQDPIRLAKTGIYNEHNVISPDICFELVRDLNSPTGKGAQLFAKRKKKSEKWIVDENTVKEQQTKHQLANDLPDINTRLPQPNLYTPTKAKTTPYKPPPANKLQEINERLNPRVKYVKSPWEAALESPIGSCDAAFESVAAKAPPLADLIAARQSYAPPPPLQDVFDILPTTPVGPPKSAPMAPSPTHRSASPYGNLYKPKVPKGWTGYTGDQPTMQYEYYQEQIPEINYSTPPRPASSREISPKVSLDQFQDYNAVPLSWSEAKHRPKSGFKPVRPKSMILTK